MQRYRAAQEGREQSSQRCNWNQTAPVHDKKSSTQLEIMAADPASSRSSRELALDLVVPELPFCSVSLRIDGAKWLQNLQQADIFLPVSPQHWQRIICCAGIDGNALLLRPCPNQQSQENNRSDSQSAFQLR